MLSKVFLTWLAEVKQSIFLTVITKGNKNNLNTITDKYIKRFPLEKQRAILSEHLQSDPGYIYIPVYIPVLPFNF